MSDLPPIIDIDDRDAVLEAAHPEHAVDPELLELHEVLEWKAAVDAQEGEE